MPAPLSIVIPTLNAAQSIGPALAALAHGLGHGLIRDLVLADGGSRDDIAAIADHAGANFVISKPGRGIQLAAGALAAKGQWLLFLHADTILSADWVEQVQNHIAEYPTMAAHFRLRFDATGTAPALVAAWANRRSHSLHLPYGDQGLLISRNHYNAIGGFPQIPLMEDVAIARAIGRNMRQLNATATTSANRYQKNGWLRQGLANNLLVLRYFLGADPVRLAQSYHRHH